MKTLKEMLIDKLKNKISEKLTITKDSKINTTKYLEPIEIEDSETPGEDYFGEEVIIIGWPFKDKNDPNYKKTKEYIKKERYSVYNDLEEIEDKEMWDYFCYAAHKDERELNCYVYGPEGVQAYREK